MPENKIYYPHYCYDCYCTYVSAKRHARCWSCNSENTINCFGQKKIITQNSFDNLQQRAIIIKCDTGTKIQENQQGTVLGHPLSACIAPLLVFIGDKMKTCPRCKETKPLSEFYKNRSEKDGHGGWCKSCALKQTKIYQKTEKGKATVKRRHQSEKGKTVQKCYRQTKKYKTYQKHYQKRYRICHPERQKAMDAVNNAIKNGKLPHVNTQLCYYCPNPAQQYHHWSYLPEYWLDVVPICIKCHRKIHWKVA